MSPRVRHSAAYRELAVKACRVAALPGGHSAECAAEDPEACDVRNGLWAEYEARLRDTQTYTIDEIVLWLKSHDVHVGRTSVHRDRKALLAAERSIVLAAEKAKRICDLIGTDNEADLMRGGRIAIAQLLFEVITDLGPEALAGMTPTQIIKLMNTGTQIGKVHAETELLNIKLDEMKTAFDDAVAGAKKKAKTSDGSLSAEQIAQVRAAVFG